MPEPAALSKAAFLLTLILLGPTLSVSTEVEQPWKRFLAGLEARLEVLTSDLEGIQQSLVLRATAEDPKLLERLAPPRRRPWGYGILPEITPSPEPSETAVERQAYSMAELASWLDRTVGRAKRMLGAAQSTHARTGRYVLLGPHPSTRRTLAHEFAHLLGFDDGYLRAFEGDPADPFGVVLIEWRGLLDNLMGAPDTGRVTEEMIDQMLAAYGGR